MKAIVLSCDKHHPFVEHMIITYQETWPDSPLVFRVPWNEIYPISLAEKYKGKVEPIKSPVNIKRTILTLIGDLFGNEWIYWCIDDIYPIKINKEVMNTAYNFVMQNRDPSILGVSILRCDGDIRDTKYASDTTYYKGTRFIRKSEITYAWWHQFFRVKILRALCKSIDDSGKLMSRSLCHFWNMLPSHKFYAVSGHDCLFGESTYRSKSILKNCAESFRKHNLPLPKEFSIMDRVELRVGY